MTQDPIIRLAHWVHPHSTYSETAIAEAIANERARIVRDLHDGLGSQLVNLLMTVKSHSFTKEELMAEITDAIDQLRLEIDFLAADQVDLASLLGQMRYRLATRLSRASVQVQWCVSPTPDGSEGGVLTADQAHHLRRLLYEVLTNVIRHAQASCVWIEAHHASSSGSQRLIVRDDGRGFDTACIKGRGLKSLAHRAEQLGAQLDIRSQIGSGTVIALQWPSHHGKVSL